MELHQCLNFLLSVSQHQVHQHLADELTPYELTPTQYGVLNTLWTHGELTPKEIGSFLHLKASSISTVLDKMQKQQLIERQVDPSNRRTILVTATEKAKALQPDVEQVIQKMNHHFLNKLEADEAEKLIATLQKLIQ